MKAKREAVMTEVIMTAAMVAVMANEETLAVVGGEKINSTFLYFFSSVD